MLIILMWLCRSKTTWNSSAIWGNMMLKIHFMILDGFGNAKLSKSDLHKSSNSGNFRERVIRSPMQIYVWPFSLRGFLYIATTGHYRRSRSTGRDLASIAVEVLISILASLFSSGRVALDHAWMIPWKPLPCSASCASFINKRDQADDTDDISKLWALQPCL